MKKIIYLLISCICLTLAACGDTSGLSKENHMEYLTAGKVADLIAMPRDEVLSAYDAAIKKDPTPEEKGPETTFDKEPIEVIVLDEPFMYNGVPAKVKFEIAREGYDRVLGVYYDFDENHEAAFNFTKEVYADLNNRYENTFDSKTSGSWMIRDLQLDDILPAEFAQYHESWINEELDSVLLPEGMEGQSRVDLALRLRRCVNESVNTTEVSIYASLHHFKGLPK